MAAWTWRPFVFRKMATFRVHYRTAEGRLAQEEVVAPSRDALFRLLEGRGVRAVSVDALSVPADPKGGGRFAGWRWRRFALFALAAGVAAGVLWLGGGRSEDASKPTGTSPARRPAPKPPEKAPPRKAAPPPAPTNAPARVHRPAAPPQPQRRLVRAETNETGAVIEDFALPDGTEVRRVTPPKPVWDNAADQLVAMAISIESGVEAPPLPAGVGDEEFLRALRKPIVVNADDPAELQRLKRRVRDARDEILKAMAQTGKSFEEVLNDHRSAMNDGTALWREAQQGYRSARDAATEEERAEYVRKVNAVLEARGARPLATGARRRGGNGRKQ